MISDETKLNNVNIIMQMYAKYNAKLTEQLLFSYLSVLLFDKYKKP